MLVKKLKSFTIIPSELYVERAADQQLRNIVANMGRPGYVLVARQMGKTNLLLNAKRKLEDDDDVFLYVDLSNSFPDIEQFFRNIIDIALDAHDDRFGSVKKEIYDLRTLRRNLPAHKEHEQELRKLLQNIRGKIVICLDEIDALTNSDYSDSVFSLIRSTYFASRINFSEFNRLTYILSGVAEPNEIIKNKNISPFNIGEKIYLDDFTYTEFIKFLKKSSISLDESSIERIFYWTSGNPRICWDLCSAIEDIIIIGTPITPSVVDKTVRRLYLTEYDLPPVDHIRKLAEDDRDIRNSVMSIHYKKFSTISDAQRNKLYLSGIIKSDFTSDIITIKNRVIEESLSEEWINYIESTKLSIMEQANNKLTDGNYFEALALFKKYEVNTAVDKDLQLLFHSIGKCCIHIEDYDQAIEYLIKKPFKKSEFPSLYYTQNQWLGSAHYYLDNIEESITCFEKVINSNFSDGEYPVTYFEASVNLSAPYFSQFERYGERILEINKRVIDNQEYVFDTAEDKNVANTLVCAAYHNFALAKRRYKSDEEAAAAWKEALQIAHATAKPKIVIELLNVLPTVEKKYYLRQMAELIKSEQFPVHAPTAADPFNFTIGVLADLVAYAFELGEEKTKKCFLQYLTAHIRSDNMAWNVLRLAGFSAIKNKKLDVAVNLFKVAIDLPRSGVSEDERRMVLHYTLLLSSGDNVQSVEKEYLTTLASDVNIELTAVDIRIIYDTVDRYLENSRFVSARKLIDLIRRKRKNTEPEVEEGTQERPVVPFVVLDYAELRLLLAERRNTEAKEIAVYIKDQLSKGLPLGAIFPQNMEAAIKEDVEYILEEFVMKFPIRNSTKKYGRNDVVQVKYKSGAVKTGKYKHLEGDIMSEECHIVG